ncbi:voltage-gated hydrogen channel 1-like [Watersipora subatra]|uniref:voltage-gated hydrogen channel 1-like n=1 Tax=Watersipora subatra TaxID=2589382 RepID=UPI00355BA04C
MKGIGSFAKANTDDLERVVEKSDTSSSIMSDDIIKLPRTIREQIADFVHSRKFQIVVICLVLLDCILVISELLIDLKAFENEASVGRNLTHTVSKETVVSNDEPSLKKEIIEAEEAEEPSLVAAEVLHYCSIAILSIFLLELFAKLFAMGKEFFHHKLEIIDAVIVVVSFALDIAFIDSEGLSSVFGLLVLLRLWRIGRIVNGIVLSMKTQADKKLNKEKGLRQAAEAELVKFREYCTAQEREIETLQLLLTQNNIEFTKMAKPTLPASTIDVVAEVNQYIEANRVVAADEAAS